MTPVPSHPAGLHASSALLPDGWARDVDIRVNGDGFVEDVVTGVLDSKLERAEGPVVPGMPDAHSHAFQRLLVGRTQTLGRDDDFWSWRQTMYRLVGVLEPEDVSDLTAWVYSELLASGYTSVAEFHYLFGDRQGRPYADPAELPRRVIDAADRAGIGLTLVPVLYTRAGFDGKPLSGSALRFASSLDDYVALVETLENACADDPIRIGVGPHSLRAADPKEIEALLQWAASDRTRPVHLHAAEQPAEVEAGVRAIGLRPVEWLLERASPGPNWTVVHATHMTSEERTGLAASGATVALCPTTEADLGDGVFPLGAWLSDGGRFGIGSDSNTCVSPAAELRLLSWTARLLSGRRGALPLSPDRPVGAQLWQLSAAGAGAALGQPVGSIQAGARADLLVLDAGRPWAEGLGPDEVLDSFVLSGEPSDIARTVVAGRIVAVRGRHVDAERLEAAARRAARAVAARLQRLPPRVGTP